MLGEGVSGVGIAGVRLRSVKLQWRWPYKLDVRSAGGGACAPACVERAVRERHVATQQQKRTGLLIWNCITKYHSLKMKKNPFHH